MDYKKFILTEKIRKDKLNYIDNNYYYSGEFGYFNFGLLVGLEKFLETSSTIITIHTFPDYCYIIKNLFGDKIECKEIKFAKLRLLNDNSEFESYKNLYKPIYKLFDMKGVTLISTNKEYISKQITTEYKDDSENFICYFPRFRDSGDIKTDFLKRNSNKNECNYILNLFSSKFKIFILGNETLSFNYNKQNIEKVEDIKRAIFYLKNCKFLISNDSGFIDFAKNCGCNHIIILRPIVAYHKIFNPFNSKITIINELKELHAFQ
jgi:hypothetical protein